MRIPIIYAAPSYRYCQWSQSKNRVRYREKAEEDATFCVIKDGTLSSPVHVWFGDHMDIFFRILVSGSAVWKNKIWLL
jgi:hypothetical protein